MSKFLGSTPFRDLLVHSIAADTTMLAAADALDAALLKSIRAIPDELLYARLARDSGFVNPVPMLSALTRLSDLAGGLAALPESALDMLAWQLHVEDYDAAVNVHAKRQLIQGSLLLHRRRGTPWAVRNALETALRLPATVREWFDYGGKPYYFRVRQDVTGAVYSQGSAENTIRLIFSNKNVRSWLDCLETVSTNPLPVSIGVGGISRTTSRARLYFTPPAPVPATMRVAVPAYGLIISRVSPVAPVPRPPRPRVLPGLAAISFTRSSVCLMH